LGRRHLSALPQRGVGVKQFPGDKSQRPVSIGIQIDVKCIDLFGFGIVYRPLQRLRISRSSRLAGRAIACHPWKIADASHLFRREIGADGFLCCCEGSA
jgi:hypothetical protein